MGEFSPIPRAWRSPAAIRRWIPLHPPRVIGPKDLFSIPANHDAEPLALAVLFPVYFRHPEAAPLPGDTVLARHDDSVATKGTTKQAAPAKTRTAPAPSGTP